MDEQLWDRERFAEAVIAAEEKEAGYASVMRLNEQLSARIYEVENLVKQMGDRSLVVLLSEIGEAGWSVKIVPWKFTMPPRQGYMLQAESFVPNDDFPAEYVLPSAQSPHYQYFTWESEVADAPGCLCAALTELLKYIREQETNGYRLPSRA